MVAVSGHPGHGLGDGLGLGEELVPHARVEPGVVGPALAGRVPVRDVAGVQMEGRVLAEEEAVVGERVVADALVAEGREGERRLVRGGGGEGAEGAQQVGFGRVEALVADAVVVRPARPQVGQPGVDVVLGVVAARADPGRCEEGADLGVDLPGEVRGVGADADERLPDGDRDLPGDGHLGARVGAVGEVAAEGGHMGAVDGLGARPSARHGGLGGGARHERATGDGAERDGTASDQRAPGESGAQVLVLLGHAHALGEPLGYAHTRSVHGVQKSTPRATGHRPPGGRFTNRRS
ncbi:hypothetical protein QFZ43_005875 [Streptomyces afghaniensis]|nr:hypothetical protein [Streptomyces afghaniensis]